MSFKKISCKSNVEALSKLGLDRLRCRRQVGFGIKVYPSEELDTSLGVFAFVPWWVVWKSW